MGETGLLGRGLSNKTLCLPTEKCNDGKFTKKLLTIHLCCNSSDIELLIPLVIGKCQTLRYFGEINPEIFSVCCYRDNRNLYMTSNLLKNGLI